MVVILNRLSKTKKNDFLIRSVPARLKGGCKVIFDTAKKK